MSDDELNGHDPLHAAVMALRDGTAVTPGLAARTRRRARRQAVRRWASGSVGIVATFAIGLIVLRGGAAPGQVTFALAAPSSAGISLVGDFNDWERDRIRLKPDGRDHWKVTVKLPPGRYRYSYVTDDGTWLADPQAPPALDEFGTPTSVLTVPSE